MYRFASCYGSSSTVVALARPHVRCPGVEVLVVFSLDAEPADFTDDDPRPVRVMLSNGVAILTHTNVCSHGRQPISSCCEHELAPARWRTPSRFAVRRRGWLHAEPRGCVELGRDAKGAGRAPRAARAHSFGSPRQPPGLAGSRPHTHLDKVVCTPGGPAYAAGGEQVPQIALIPEPDKHKRWIGKSRDPCPPYRHPGRLWGGFLPKRTKAGTTYMQGCHSGRVR
jgi:hypothetical protein